MVRGTEGQRDRGGTQGQRDTGTQGEKDKGKTKFDVLESCVEKEKRTKGQWGRDRRT